MEQSIHKPGLRQLKAAATRKESRRVFDNMNLPPRNITVEFEGRVYTRYAWQAGRIFGWERWTVES